MRRKIPLLATPALIGMDEGDVEGVPGRAEFPGHVFDGAVRKARLDRRVR